MPDDPSANSEQARLWNEVSGKTWLDMQDVLDPMLEPVSDILIEHAALGNGRKVLDVGCGGGATTLQMAARLAPSAHCLGVDISAPLISAAQGRTRPPGRVTAFIKADVQTYAFEQDAFDTVISRFGVMFFDDPVAAFANIRRACSPGASLTFMAWRRLEENPFFGLAQNVAKDFVTLPDHTPDAPGQFAFADPDWIGRILKASGWRFQDVRAIDVPTQIPASHLQAYLTRMGPLGAVFSDLDLATRDALAAALRSASEPFVVDGAVRFQAACWLVTASA